MGRKYVGKRCAYCAQKTADTEEHIFARSFFLVQERANLPKAPGCNACNRKKADLEHYLTTVLGFGGKHAGTTANLALNAPRRLGKNRKLHTKLLAGAEMAWLKDEGAIYVPTVSLPFDGAKLEELLKYIARGLAWHHFGKYMGADWCIRVLFPPDIVSSYFQALFETLGKEKIVAANLGRETVYYAGALIGPPDLFMWKIRFYGGIPLGHSGGERGAATETSRLWWVLAGPPEIAAQIMGQQLRRSIVTAV